MISGFFPGNAPRAISSVGQSPFYASPTRGQSAGAALRQAQGAPDRDNREWLQATAMRSTTRRRNTKTDASVYIARYERYAIRTTQSIAKVGESAATQHTITTRSQLFPPVIGYIWITTSFAAAPLPHVASHIQTAIGACASRISINRCCSSDPVIEITSILIWLLTAPWKDSLGLVSCVPGRSLFPFGFCRKPYTHPLAKS